MSRRSPNPWTCWCIYARWYARARHRQIVGWGHFIRRHRCRMLALTRHRCDKGVTPAGVVGDVALARAAVAKRLPERGDMDPERTFVNNGVGPGTGYELILADGSAGAFNKCDEDVQGPGAEPRWFPVLKQHALSGD